MVRSLFISMLIYFTAENTSAQVLADTGEISIEIAAIISGMPGDSGDDFSDATSSQLNSWGNAIRYLLDGNYTKAADTANILSYDLIKFIDTSETSDITYYILKANSTKYWGTYVYNPNYCINLVIQSPHPIKDFNTGKEGCHVFHKTNSKFFMMGGTSRCNHSTFSSCSGTTSICTGSSESYRISDLAHQSSSTFQVTTDSLVNRNANTYFLQLHGFTKLSSDPFIILSNGTRVTPATDKISSLKTNLEAEDALFVDSIKIAHIDLSWTRLIGFGNVQGRLINSSADICNTNASSTNGRFIHMEQEKTRLRDNEAGWNKVVNAVNNTFTCSALPVVLLNFKASVDQNRYVNINWSTAREINNSHFIIQRSSDAKLWLNITSVESKGNGASHSDYEFTDYAPINGISYYRLQQIDTDGQTTFSDPVVIKNYINSSLKTYPNPSSDKLFIVGKFSTENLKIIDLMGNIQQLKIKDIVVKNQETIVQLDISNLSNGAYFVKSGQFSLAKFIKTQ